MKAARPLVGYRFEVRAVWHSDELTKHTRSQPAEKFDLHPMEKRRPDQFGVYAIGGGHVQDYVERGSAQTHADQLNGVAT